MTNAPMSSSSAGARMRKAVAESRILPFIGVYDTFSASLAARHFDALFVSGFGFAASHYALPDIGFITWTDILAFVQRLRIVLPAHHLLVDIDDGYCDTDIACHVVTVLEAAGASGVVLEDQKRPRRCGHFDGKQIMELDDYLAKLKAVLAARRDLFVIARTDSSDPDDIARRVNAFAAAGADAVLVDGLPNLETIKGLVGHIDRPFCFNQMAGGKSPPYTLTELTNAGVSLVIYSTPCLFAAQAAIDGALLALKANDGTLVGSPIGVRDCTQILSENLARVRERP